MDSWYWWLSLCELLGDLMGFLCLMCCLCCGCRKTICEITSWIYQFKGSTSAGHSPLDFCNLAHCAQPSQLGWRHERTIVPIFFTTILMKMQYSVEDVATVWKLEFVERMLQKNPHLTKFWFPGFQFWLFLKKKLSDVILSNWWRLSFTKLLLVYMAVWCIILSS